MPRIVVELGNTYGDIVVDKRGDKTYPTFVCHCLVCGGKYMTTGQSILKWAKDGCPTCRSMRKKRERCEEYIGRRFGNLEVVGYAGEECFGKKRKRKLAIAECICHKCGEKTEIPINRLLDGGATQCKRCNQKNLKIGHDIASDSAAGGSTVIAVDGRRQTNKNSTTGINGVSYVTKIGYYRAYINFQRKQYSLGIYKDKKDAAAARARAEEEIYGGFLDWYKETYPDRWERLQKTRKDEK